MKKIVSRVVLTAAAVTMAALPIAAQANTRAGDSGAVYSASAPGLGREAEGEELAGGFSLIVALIAAAAVIAGVITVSELSSDDDDDQSPGT